MYLHRLKLQPNLILLQNSGIRLHTASACPDAENFNRICRTIKRCNHTPVTNNSYQLRTFVLTIIILNITSNKYKYVRSIII